jgi:tetratricopeptide (TPR) repeat protein
MLNRHLITRIVVASCLAIVAVQCPAEVMPSEPTIDFEALVPHLVAESEKADDDFDAFAMWLPQVLFVPTASSSNSAVEQDRAQIADAFSSVALFAVGQATKGEDGGLHWLTSNELFEGLSVTYINAEGKPSVLTKAEYVKPAAKAASCQMQPFFVDGFGDNAANIFFWFADNAPPQQIDPYSSGRIEVTFTQPNGTKITKSLQLPLKAMLSARESASKVDEVAPSSAHSAPDGDDNSTASIANEPITPDKSKADRHLARAVELVKGGDATNGLFHVIKAIEFYGGDSRTTDPEVRVCLSLKAKALFDLGDLDGAEKTLLHLIDSPNKEANPAFAVADQMGWGVLADTYLSQKEFQRGLDALQRQESAEATVVGMRPLVRTQHRMASLQKMANAYTGLGDYDAALRNLREAEELYKEHFPDDQSMTAVFESSNGLVEEKKGDLQKAEACYRRALQLYVAARGPASVSALSSLSNIYRVCVAQGRDDEARAIEKQAAEIEISGDGKAAVAAAMVTPKYVDTKNGKQILGKAGPDVDLFEGSDHGVAAVVMAAALTCTGFLVAITLTILFQRVRPDFARWTVAWVMLGVVFLIIGGCLAAIESSFTQNASMRGLNARSHYSTVRSISTLIALPYSIAFVLTVISAFKSQAASASRALIGPRVLASLTCVAAVMTPFPASIMFGRFVGAHHLTRISNWCGEFTTGGMAYVFLLSLVWMVAGILGAGVTALTRGKSVAPQPPATPSPPVAPPSGS